jgi:CDP-diacylglycerol--serine O-phosphatidyltransferase
VAESRALLRSFTPADFVTLGNASCGTGAIFFCLNHLETRSDAFLLGAFVLVGLALVLDVGDGMIARHYRRSSPFGADLDSLADVVSFGVAPAVLGFTLGLRGGWDAAILLYFVGCGISRLARYNATAAALSDDTGKVKYYEGTPIPTSLLLVVMLGVAFMQNRIGDQLWLGVLQLGPWKLHPLALVYALSGSFMISTIRIPKP